MIKTVTLIFVLAAILFIPEIVIAQNNPPVISEFDPSYNIPQGDVLEVTLTATDADVSDVLTFSLIPPADDPTYEGNMAFVDNGDRSATMTFTPSYTQTGAITLSVIVSDGTDEDTTSTIIIITNVDADPILDSIGPKSVTEGQLLSFTVTASDPDATFPTISFAVDSLPGAQIENFFNDTALFTFTPDFLQGATGGRIYIVPFFAFDNSGNTDSEYVEITVFDAGNQPPTIDPVGPQSVIEGSSLQFDINAHDPEKDSLLLEAINVPLNGSFQQNDDSTGTFAFNPGLGQTGDFDVSFIATDDSAAADTLIVTISVLANTNPPVFDAIAPQSVTEGNLLVVNFSASDPDNVIPTLDHGPLPGTMIFADSGDGTGTLEWTPGFTEAGDYSVTLYASDGQLEDTAIVEITVFEFGNHAPVLTPIGDTTIFEDSILNISVAATDLDLDSIILSAEGLPAANATFTDYGNGTGMLNFHPDLRQAGSYAVDFIASDTLQGADTVTVTITVEQSDWPPVLSSLISPYSLDEGRELEFDLVATDSESLPYVWINPPISNDSVYGGAATIDFRYVTTGADSTIAHFTWSPGYDFLQIVNETATHVLKFYATDFIDTVSRSLTVEIHNVPRHTGDSGLADTLFFAGGFWTGQGDHKITCYVFNDDTLTGASTGFKWTDPNLICDSIRLGPRFDSASFKQTNIYPDSLMFYVGFLFLNNRFIDSGSGEYFSVYFHYDQPGDWNRSSVALVDTSRVGNNGDFIFDRALKLKASNGFDENNIAAEFDAASTYIPLIKLTPVKAAFDSLAFSVYDVAENRVLTPFDSIVAGVDDSGNYLAYDIYIALENPDSLGAIDLGLTVAPRGSAQWSYVDQGQGTGAAAVIPSRMDNPLVWIASGGLIVDQVDILTVDTFSIAATAGLDAGSGLPSGQMQGMISIRFIPAEPIDEVDSICIDTAMLASFTDKLGNVMTPGFSGQICFPIKKQLIVEADENGPVLPRASELYQNYPNPFNPTTTIKFSLVHSSHVTITVFNILGQTVRVLADAEYSAGEHEVIWDGRDGRGRAAASGIYLYHIDSEYLTKTKKMILLK